ncbi:MAG: DUF4340 domain-containing protein [Leptolyngbyaceae bacterium]|nr:DUF4340 domain-containing protein [Leptolyngbyaceae bacterium]
MKLKAPTVFLVGIAAILGLIVFAEFQGGDRPTTTDGDSTGQPLFAFEEEDVQSFTVETPLDTLSFERDDEGVWQMVEPEEFTANDASVSFLLNLLATEESDRQLTVSPDELGDFGLDDPQTTIDVVLEDATTHQLVLGDFDFSQQSMYARVDPEATEGEETLDVALVTTTFDSAVNRPLEEWQQTEPDQPPEEPDSSEPTDDAEPNGEASEAEGAETDADETTDTDDASVSDDADGAESAE